MAKSKKKALVIVESPAKAKKIQGFLGSDYEVRASVGHIRDLPSKAAEIPKQFKSEPWSELGVNVNQGFEPLYVISPEKKKVVKELKELLKDADELIIATDEDREGEAIGWHIAQVLEPKVPVKRMTFSEITKKAIVDALNNPRQIDMNMVEAQETRRVLDRLYGYRLSPLLWRKVAPKLSAGRVQSVAVRILVQRELERLAFKRSEYWDLTATLTPKSEENHFDVTLFQVKQDGDSDWRPVASGKDFDGERGVLKEDSKAVQLLEPDATQLVEALSKPNVTWEVESVDKKPGRRRTFPPFITSTLQQAANNVLNMSARQTMSTAQRLYENGHITYMRTDSVNLSQEALNAARDVVLNLFDQKHYDGPKQHTGKKAKNAQEAHEAIRPAGTDWKSAKDLGLSGAEASLYDLIWKRAIASQMSDYEYLTTTYTVKAENCRFKASGSVDTFLGWQAIMRYGKKATADKSNLPDVSEGGELALVASTEEANPKAIRHETTPPARYTEASLVKKLEDEGIGRPSTYASIISTVQDRGYVKKSGSQLVPTFTAMAVNKLMENHFGNLVDLSFTAAMEDSLDDISNGVQERQPYLDKFYHGEGGLDHQVEEKITPEGINPRDVCTLSFENVTPVVRVGRYGPFLEAKEGEESINASLPDDLNPGDLTDEMAMKLIELKKQGPKPLGMHPDEQAPIYVKIGPFGPYLQMGEDLQEGDDGPKPKRVSIPKNYEPTEVELDLAVKLLSLPKRLGHHPEDNKVVNAGIGRYGPYVQHSGKMKGLEKTDDILTITLDRAVELLKQAKQRGAPEPLRKLGQHPTAEEEIGVFEGRYGPYVKCGKINATIPKESDPQQFTLEEAVKLIDEKAEKTGKSITGKKKKATKKSTKKKATKKKAAKKTTKKKKATKKKS